jgi:hypothetical protein
MHGEYLKRKSGNITQLSSEEFEELFNVVLYEKARREMATLRPTSNHTYRAGFVAEGKGNGVGVTPISVEFKREGLQEWFEV